MYLAIFRNTENISLPPKQITTETLEDMCQVYKTHDSAWELVFLVFGDELNIETFIDFCNKSKV
jgi:hypothetical protein